MAKESINKKLVVMPKLYYAGGDVTKQWFAHYRVRNPKTDNMVRYKVYVSNTFESYTTRMNEANRVVQELTAKLAAGWNPLIDDKVIFADNLKYSAVDKKYKDAKRRNITMRMHVTDFLNGIRHTVRNTTWETYQSKFRQFVQFVEEYAADGVDIVAVNEQVIGNFYTHLRTQKKVSNSTINYYTDLLNRFYVHLIELGKVQVNPVAHVKKLPEQVRVPKFFSDAMIASIKQYAMQHDAQLWLMIQFLFFCYIRPKELRFLQLKHINFHNTTITVSGDISKNGKTQTVQMPRVLYNQLVERGWNKMPEEYYCFSVLKVPGVKHVSKNYFWNHFDTIRKELNIPQGYWLYYWKHTGAIRFKKRGGDVRELQTQLRHHSLEEVQKYLEALTGIESQFILDSPEL